VVQIDEGRIQAHSDEGVRSTVEETLNALLDAEADRLCGAKKYERTEGRKDTRAGSYDRKLGTKAGAVTLTVPKLRTLPFETAIIERYRRRESSVEEALIEMCLAGVSVRRVEDITQALGGRASRHPRSVRSTRRSTARSMSGASAVYSAKIRLPHRFHFSGIRIGVLVTYRDD
jgi:transposase-like protein